MTSHKFHHVIITDHIFTINETKLFQRFDSHTSVIEVWRLQ